MVAGDTVRWQIAETTSGSGASMQTHVVLKPLRGDLTTNLVLTTSERVYLLNLRATNQANSANAAVAWEYPIDAPLDVEAILADPARAAELGARLPLDQLETRYRVETRGFMASRPAWMPETVFDDGAKTFIRFPAIAAHVELPPLFVIGADGEAQLVNYRVRGQTYVVDQLFERGELRLGSQRVRLTRQVPIGATAPVASITGGRP
jgi:type IV secretion system protein VirB9